MRLIVTEKPDMARKIAAALGATQKSQGFIEGGQNIITWCFGHLVELNEPDAYDPKFKEWRVEDLPIIPERFGYHANRSSVGQLKLIKSLMDRSDVVSIVNSCDAEREGELIFDRVYAFCGCRKPVERLWISSLTPDEIIKGFNNLKPGANYRGLRDSALCRQQADWLTGINGTRSQTLKARQGGYDSLFSLGRVQTPTLALIVKRDLEIKNFVPSNYYELAAKFQSSAGQYGGLWFNDEGSRIKDEATGKAIIARISGKPGIIDSVEKKLCKEQSPLLYDLAELQRTGNIRFGFSAAKTLEIAQSLYEKQLTTYPRTSSRYLSSSIGKELKSHIDATNAGPYMPFVSKITLKGRFTLTSRHINDKRVTDHHAIIPTNQLVDLNALSADEKVIYDLIARRFLAAFYDDAESERTIILTTIVKEKFISRGKILVSTGWREVEAQSNNEKPVESVGDIEDESVDDSNNGNDILPAVKAKESVRVNKLDLLTKQTKAPPRFSESSLLTAMETAGKQIEDEEFRQAMKDNGLGRAATRHTIIETLIDRGYIERKKRALIATSKGISLIELLPYELLKSPEMTGQWEKKLAMMERGEYPAQTFMQEIRHMVTEMVAQIGASTMELKIDESNPDQLICPKCKLAGRSGLLHERNTDKGTFVVCSNGKEVCGFISEAPKNKLQKKALIEAKCPNCKGLMRLRLPRDRTQAAVMLCLNYAECKGHLRFDSKGALVEAQQSNEAGPNCECGGATVKRGPAKNGSYFWVCTLWKQDGSGCKVKPVWITADSDNTQDALRCPKCLVAGRNGILRTFSSQKGKFAVCSLGKDVCGFISDIPKTNNQKKALMETRCHSCKNAMRLRLPEEKGGQAVLLCLNYAACKGIRRFNEKGALLVVNTDNPNIENGPACSKCGGATVKRGPFRNNSFFYSCVNWKRDGSGCKAEPIWINDKPLARRLQKGKNQKADLELLNSMEILVEL